MFGEPYRWVEVVKLVVVKIVADSSPLRKKAGVGSSLLRACHCAGGGVDGKNVSSSSYYY